MFLAKIVLAAFTCTSVTNYIFVAGQDDSVPEELDEQQEEEASEPPPVDNHRFVALIDIVFTDGRKRTCTGTIIHDNVVITAAHCFVDHNVYIEAELTASFVVIGTKQMYDTGYENYLPIERVITHPKFRGWTADLALIYTFAGMTSDKPGKVMPLIGESALTPVDSNVTILSWGICKEEIPVTLTKSPDTNPKKRICTSSEENNDSCEKPSSSTLSPLRAGASSSEPETSSETDSSEQSTNRDRKLQTRGVHVHTSRGSDEGTPRRVDRLTNHKSNSKIYKKSTTAKRKSRYLSAELRQKRLMEVTRKPIIYHPQKHRYHKATRNTSRTDEDLMIVLDTQDHNQPYRDPTRRKMRLIEGSAKQKEQRQLKQNKNLRIYTNWRRSIGTKENKLTIETFGFVNVQTCKKLVDKALPALYSINTNEVVCYAADDHYMSDDDSGAPAIRQGHLVAVTLGGVECDGDHVAVGVKMSCFCSWIAENLPYGGEEIKCSKEPCTSNAEVKEDQNTRHRHRSIRK